MIVRLEHNPVRTRSYAGLLPGKCGVIEALMRNGSVALIRLDGRPWDLPDGIRRWSIHCDDLIALDNGVVTPPEDPYRLGLSITDGARVHHAVRPETSTSLCGDPVSPLPWLEWSLRFVPAATAACPACVQLVISDPADRGTRTMTRAPAMACSSTERWARARRSPE